MQYFETEFSNEINVNITFGWGEVDGQPLDAGALAENSSLGGYTSIGADFLHPRSVVNQPSVQTAALSMPGGGLFKPLYITEAQAQLFGFVGASSTEMAGYVGLSADAPFTFDPGPAAMQTFGMSAKGRTRPHGSSRKRDSCLRS